MALAEDLSIYKTTRDLCRLVFATVRNMPRDVKHTLGRKLMDECTDMTVLILRANSSEQKDRHLQELREHQKTAELISQLLFDMRCIGTDQFARATELLASIGKQASGWKRSSAASPDARPSRRS